MFIKRWVWVSKYNFEVANTDMLFRHFDDAFNECKSCLEAGLPLPAYDQCMIASHAFKHFRCKEKLFLWLKDKTIS